MFLRFVKIQLDLVTVIKIYTWLIYLYQLYDGYRFMDLIIFEWEWWRKVHTKKNHLTRINRSLPCYSDYRVGNCPVTGFEIFQSAVKKDYAQKICKQQDANIIQCCCFPSLSLRQCTNGVFSILSSGRSAFCYYFRLIPSSIQMDSPWTMDNTLAMKFHTIRAGGSKQTFQRPTKRRK